MQITNNAPTGKHKIYSILNDFVFQWLFNRPGREKITCSLLNVILQLEGDRQIESVWLLNAFRLRGGCLLPDFKIKYFDAFISRKIFGIKSCKGFNFICNANAHYFVIVNFQAFWLMVFYECHEYFYGFIARKKYLEVV